MVKQVWQDNMDWNLDRKQDLTPDEEKLNTHISASIVDQASPTQVVENETKLSNFWSGAYWWKEEEDDSD